MSTPTPKKENSMTEANEVLQALTHMTKQWEEVCVERDGLKTMLRRLNEHVMPGEIDSIDSLRILIKERDEARAIVEKLATQQDLEAAYTEMRKEVRARLNELVDLCTLLQRQKDLNIDLKNLCSQFEKERDEARAEVERLKQKLEKQAVTIDACKPEFNLLLRQEVVRLNREVKLHAETANICAEEKSAALDLLTECETALEAIANNGESEWCSVTAGATLTKLKSHMAGGGLK